MEKILEAIQKHRNRFNSCNN